MGLAAIALILPVYMINCMFAHGLGLGGSVRYSRLLGEGKPGEAVDSFNQVVTGALAFSILTGILGNVFMTPFLAVLALCRMTDRSLKPPEATWRCWFSHTSFLYV